MQMECYKARGTECLPRLADKNRYGGALGKPRSSSTHSRLTVTGDLHRKKAPEEAFRRAKETSSAHPVVVPR